ncbi:MAG TPA: TetR family transcriptional regulator [Vicinamibacteria bacterium]
MSPRPRQASDEDLLRAAFRAVARRGPAGLTLADVAAEAGVSAAAVAQRFGSKRALLLAMAADVATGDLYIFPGLRARHRSPVAALLGLADCMAPLFGGTPEGTANTLAFLQTDLGDPDFHRHALAASEGMRRGIRALVRDAIGAGELVRGDASRLASALHAALSGSLLAWAVHREGDLAAWLRRDLGTVLEGYRAERQPGRRGPRGRRPGRLAAAVSSGGSGRSREGRG